jgi:hypothetical protein
MRIRSVVGRRRHILDGPGNKLAEPVEYVVLAFPRGGPPTEIAREPQQWMAQALAFEERRRGMVVEIEERPRVAA